MKRRSFLVMPVIILLALSLIFACDSPAKADEPEITIDDIVFDNSTLSRTTVDIGLTIENPNETWASLDKLVYDIYFACEGERVLLGQEQDGKMRVEGDASDSWLFTTTITDQRILERVMELSQGEQPCFIEIDGDARMQVGFASFQISFEKEVRVLQDVR